MRGIYSYIASPDHAAAVGAWGLIIGIFSTLLGVVGFGITLYQVRKVKAAAQASSEAISSLRIKLNHLDLIQECARAESALGYIREHILNSRTDVPLTIFDSLAMALVNINESAIPLHDSTKRRLQLVIGSINKLSIAPKSGDRNVTAKQMAAIREYHGLLVSIKAQIQEGQLA